MSQINKVKRMNTDPVTVAQGRRRTVADTPSQSNCTDDPVPKVRPTHFTSGLDAGIAVMAPAAAAAAANMPHAAARRATLDAIAPTIGPDAGQRIT